MNGNRIIRQICTWKRCTALSTRHRTESPKIRPKPNNERKRNCHLLILPIETTAERRKKNDKINIKWNHISQCGTNMCAVHINSAVYTDNWNPTCNKINNNNNNGNRAATFHAHDIQFSVLFISFHIFVLLLFVNDELIFLAFHRNQIKSNRIDECPNRRKNNLFFSLRFIYSVINNNHTMLAAD